MDNRYILIFSIISFVLTLPIIGIILYKQLKRYGIMKKDVLLGLSVSKVLVNMTSNILLEYGFGEDRVKVLSVIVLKSIDYIVSNIDSNSLSEDVKVNKAMAIAKCLLLELDIVLSVDEEDVVRDVLKIGLSITNNDK